MLSSSITGAAFFCGLSITFFSTTGWLGSVAGLFVSATGLFASAAGLFLLSSQLFAVVPELAFP